VVADLEPAALIEVAKTVNPAVLQLHGEEPASLIEELRGHGPWRIWKAVAVRGPKDVAAARERFGGLVDGFVLDAWDPKQRGGTGQRFPWHAVRSETDGLGEEALFVAAGGLGVHNVQEAISLLQPDVVDVSSGVESRPGWKDPDLVMQFIRRAKGGDAGGQL
jgi:phosphoribosylanthranilate isomerase